MPVVAGRREYCVRNFKHTIIPVIEGLCIGINIATAFQRFFEFNASWGDDNIISRRVPVPQANKSINLHFIFVDDVKQIADAVSNVYEKRMIDKNDMVGVILQGRNIAGNELVGMAETIEEKTGAHVCVW